MIDVGDPKRSWNTRGEERARRLAALALLSNGKVLPTGRRSSRFGSARAAASTYLPFYISEHHD
jgi:hypothetical protein